MPDNPARLGTICGSFLSPRRPEPYWSNPLRSCLSIPDPEKRAEGLSLRLAGNGTALSKCLLAGRCVVSVFLLRFQHVLKGQEHLFLFSCATSSFLRTAICLF